jgi:hypothetical protein
MGRQGKTGATGARGPRGARGATGAIGRRGEIGKLGRKGPKGLRGPWRRDELLDTVETHFDDVYRQLNVQIRLLAKLQLQVNVLIARAARFSSAIVPVPARALEESRENKQNQAADQHTREEHECAADEHLYAGARDEKRQRVPHAPERRRRAADHATDPRGTPARQAAVVGQRFGESHADPCAQRCRHSDEERGPTVVSRKGCRKNRSQR